MSLHYTNTSLINVKGERWLPIEGYEGFYEVSSMGRLKGTERFAKHGEGTLKKVKSVMKRQFVNKHGYLILTLAKKGSVKTFTVHRLVCKAFHDNHENKATVNHKKGVKLDNRATEIEWATISENGLHSYKNGLSKPSTYMKGRCGLLANNIRAVACVDDLGKRRNFISLTEAEKELSAKKSNICNSIKKGIKAYGFRWEYVNK